MTKKTTTRQAQPQPVDGPVTKDAKPPVITHLTPDERAAIGRTARAKTPRESHAAWTAPAERPDPIELLEEQARKPGR